MGGKPSVKLTVFERSVYTAVKKIIRGRVSTYRDVAKAINRPKAVRAVGNALNKNPFAPAVPCHRVVKSDGRVGGFAGGKKKKIKLLKREGVVVIKGRLVEFKKIKLAFNLKTE